MASILFEKAKIGWFELKNRFLMSAAAGWKTGSDGRLKVDGMVHYEVAGGGAALVSNGGIGVHPSAKRTDRAIIMTDDMIPVFAQVADRIKEAGAGSAFQVTHSGLWSGVYQKEKGGTPFTPSFIIDDQLLKYDSPNRIEQEADEELIYEVINAYGEAAKKAKEAGFDAVEVHGAHDSLLAQFLSPVTNLRNDKWGGSVENRCRFHVEVLKSIRRKIGEGFPIILKLGAAEDIPGGLTVEDGAEAAGIIASAGSVNAIEVSQGLSSSPMDFRDMSIKTGINSIDKEAYYREWTKAVKKAVGDKVLIIEQGGLRSIELMEEVIEKGEADLVSMCRPHLREPGLVNRWALGDREKAKCISCNQCVIEGVMKGKSLYCPLRK